LHRVVPEVGHDLVVEVLVDRALDDRPHAAEPDLVRPGVAALLREVAELRLQVAAELELEVAARRLEEEAVLPAGEDLLLAQLLLDDGLDGWLVQIRLGGRRRGPDRRRASAPRHRPVEAVVANDLLGPSG